MRNEKTKKSSNEKWFAAAQTCGKASIICLGASVISFGIGTICSLILDRNERRAAKSRNK